MSIDPACDNPTQHTQGTWMHDVSSRSAQHVSISTFDGLQLRQVQASHMSDKKSPYTHIVGKAARFVFCIKPYEVTYSHFLIMVVSVVTIKTIGSSDGYHTLWALEKHRSYRPRSKCCSRLYVWSNHVVEASWLFVKYFMNLRTDVPILGTFAKFGFHIRTQVFGLLGRHLHNSFITLTADVLALCRMGKARRRILD